MRYRLAVPSVSVCALLVLIACDQGTTPPEAPGIFLSQGEQPGPAEQSPLTGVVEAEYFEVCKQYVGTPGPDVTVNVDVVSHEAGNDQNFNITLGDGECEDVWLHGGPGQDVVTATETVPAGYTASFDKTVVGPLNAPGSGPGNSAMGVVNGANGVLVVFTNTEIVGGEGCTPGYWKNHTGLKKQTNQWPPTGFGQGDSFDATFAVVSSFGGTLLEALNRGGGGENALGRHAVAALLNAAHPAVSYDLSVPQVIAAVGAAYASGDFEGTKNTLAAFNEQGCPIGN